MKKLITLTSITLALFVMSCGGGQNQQSENSSSEESKTQEAGEAPAYDAKRGEGKHTAESLALTDAIDEAKATSGENISNVKCFSCHKASDEKLVGPGWKGVTARRTPEWIMNFITNPDPMLDKDPEAQAMLELCLVRMPNQNLTDEDSRNILEYMRKNDATK